MPELAHLSCLLPEYAVPLLNRQQLNVGCKSGICTQAREPLRPQIWDPGLSPGMVHFHIAMLRDHHLKVYYLPCAHSRE